MTSLTEFILSRKPTYFNIQTETKHFVNHIDGNKVNNSVNNLEVSFAAWAMSSVVKMALAMGMPWSKPTRVTPAPDSLATSSK